MGVFPTDSEVRNFFRRYDRNSDGRITFEDFSEAFTPLNDYYAHQLSIRPSNHRSTSLRRDDCFSSETQIAFRQMWRLVFTHENKATARLQTLCKSCFSPSKAFQMLDSSNTGLVTDRDMVKAIAARGHLMSEDDAMLLVRRICKRKS